MNCDYPLYNDSTLKINLTKHLKITTLFKYFQTALTGEKRFWKNKYALINALVVSHKDNVSFTYFANVKHTPNPI